MSQNEPNLLRTSLIIFKSNIATDYSCLPLSKKLTVVAGVFVWQGVSKVGHLLLGLERGLPLGLGQIYGQLMDAAGVENLGGGIRSGLGCLAWAVVVGFGGEVYAAVYGSIREHGAALIPLARREIWDRGREFAGQL